MDPREAVRQAITAQQHEAAQAQMTRLETKGRQQINIWFTYTMPLSVTAVSLIGFPEKERPIDADNDESKEAFALFLVIAGGIRFTVKYYDRYGMRLWLEGREYETSIHTLQELFARLS